MRRRPLWQIAVQASPEAEEIVAELLQQVFGLPVAVHTEVPCGRITASVYCESRSDRAKIKRATLAEGLRQLRAGGLDVGAGRITVKRLRRENWAESWKRHFKPMEIGAALLIKPSWSRCVPRKNQAVVVLDPGLSFGTGHHATTAFCLGQLVACRQPGRRQSFLDVGTGSGILAIAAAKLGYRPVHALDSDPEAVRVARANAAQNGVADRICFSRRDLTQLPRESRRRFDLICANLIFDLLLKERVRILNRLSSTGRLILAGILGTQFASLRQAYELAGLRRVGSRNQEGWHSGAFTVVH